MLNIFVLLANVFSQIWVDEGIDPQRLPQRLPGNDTRVLDGGKYLFIRPPMGFIYDGPRLRAAGARGHPLVLPSQLRIFCKTFGIDHIKI